MTIGFDEPFLSHHGVKGQKWGLRRYQNEDGSLTDEGKQRYGNSVFISGTTKTSEDGLYKRDKLPDKISKEIDKYITEGRKILVGDAPGIDSQVQDYLSGKNYKNVEVFVSEDEVHKMAGEKLDWTVNNIDGENFEKYSKEWRAVKDKAMNSAASEGLAVVIKNGSSATRNNISRFIDAGKKVSVYQLDDDNFVDPKSNRDEYEKMKHDDLIEKGSDFLAHYGVKGMRKGVRRWTNEDGTLTEAGKEHYGIGLDTGAKMNKKATSVYAKAQRAYAEGDYYSKLYGERAKKYDEKHDETEKEKYAKKYRTEITKGVEAAKQREMAERLLKQIEESANFDKVDSKDRVFNFYKTRGRQFLDNIPVIIPTPYFTYIGINNGVRRDAVLMTKDKTEDGYKHDVKTVFEWGSKKKKPKQEQKPEQKQAPERVKFEDMVDGELKMFSVELKPGQTKEDAIKEYYDKKKVKHDDLIEKGSDFLAHYGVKGMRKGVRRWQNEDGSLTPDGYLHYGIDPNGRNKGKIDDTVSTRQILDIINKNVYEIPDNIKYESKKSIEKYNKIAEDGLKTLISLERPGSSFAKDVEDDLEGWKEWFMYEDQTIGYPQIIAFMNDGYTANDIKKMIKAAKSDEVDDVYTKGIFELRELYEPDEFIDAYDKILNDKNSEKLNLEQKKVKHDDLIASGENFLAHHGIKGQQWGQRRFQNEDGSLTPEGRIRYGLKPEYANLSDKEMNDAMSRKRYQNQYVDLMTAKSRKKKSDMDSLISEIGKFTNTGIDVVDKIGLQGFKDYNKQMQTDAENRNKAANRAKSVAGISAEERARIENEIAANNAEIARSKQALSDTKNAVEGFKKGVQATNETIAFKNKMIKDNAEIRRDREIAMRNIEEMDPDQLKKTVDRMLLEKQYDELLNPPKPSKVEKGKEILQTIGAVAGVALTVAQLIRLFKGKGDDTAKEGDEDGEYLAHYGVEGMKKGVRRWTYEDGSLTPEGYRHYGIDPNRVTARVAKTPEQKRKELKEQARQREFTKKLEARQALRDAKTQSQIQSVYDRQRLQTQYAEGKLGNKLAAENRANVRRNIIKGVVAVAATVSAMYVGRHILRESSLNNAHLREIDKINEESRMRINEAVAKADTIRLTDKDLVRLQNEDNADARRHAEEMGRQINEATRNAHQQITGSQGAYLTSTKNVAENTTNKMEKLYRSSTSSRGLTAETGDAVRGRGRGARAVSYGGNALAINGTPEGGAPGDHAVGQRARAYERSSKHYKVSDESRKNGIDAMEKISRRYNIGATKVSKFALKGHNSIAARGLEALRLLALR